MKILNKINKSAIISKIKYPFIKISSLFERISVSNRIQITENPKYFSRRDSLGSSKDFNSKTINDIKRTHENEYQDIDQYKDNKKISLKTETVFEHLYTRINKTGNGRIDRYLPSDQNVSSDQNTKVIKHKSNHTHPYLKEMVPPPIPPKNCLLTQELIKESSSFVKSLLVSGFKPLSALKGFEISI